MPRTYPIHLTIEGKLCVVVGGGAVAERKVSGLLAAGARVRLVSPELTPELQTRANAGEIEEVTAAYESTYLADAFLVFAATGDRAVNARIAADAMERGIPVNVVDTNTPQAGGFVVPAVVRRGELCLSVSTGGATPMLAAQIRQELEQHYGPEYEELTALLGRMRAYVQETAGGPARSRAALESLIAAEAEMRELLRAGQPEAAEERARSLVNAALEREDWSSSSSE
ncbi:MAG TPA: bifunctional precorrin-2 dehydrogenase/sirohydrochlorin ferrochelatase [Chthonomonadaceae bacterium]|nr:bifunctional precorrin-2 dehydrogenase/sirohydrochlorin ferrochelatase [Chthonomonadaceae bacterium]